ELPTSSEKERHKFQQLYNTVDKRGLDRPVKVELYKNEEVITAEIVKKYDQGVIKFFLIKPGEISVAGYLQSLWEKELSKWVWGSREANIIP
ncbi:MAG: hypothetical protein ACM3YE_05960, partial [Bacteroidota bacterium]